MRRSRSRNDRHAGPPSSHRREDFHRGGVNMNNRRPYNSESPNNNGPPSLLYHRKEVNWVSNRGSNNPESSSRNFPSSGHHNPKGRQNLHHPQDRYLDDDILHCPTFAEWRSFPDSYADPSQQAYSRYVKEWNDRRIQFFVDRHWKEEWFLQRYDASLWKQIQDRNRLALIARAESMTLDTPEPIPNHELDRVVFIPSILPMIPMACVEAALTATGAQAIFFSDVNKSVKRKDLGRRVLVVYPEADIAQKILQQGHVDVSFFVDPDGATRCVDLVPDESTTESVHLVAQSRRTSESRCLPLDACTPERISHDCQRSYLLAKTLDEAEGLSSMAGVDRFIERCGERCFDDSSKLDCVLFYLRRVHVTEYYVGVRCQDEGEFVHRFHSPYVRPSGGVISGIESDVRMAAVDSQVDKLLQEFAMPNVMQRREQLDIAVKQVADIKAQTLQDFVQACTVKEGEKKYVCTLPKPRKVFEAPHFIEKYILRLHQTKLKQAERKAMFKLLVDQFCADTDKPFPRLPRFIQEIIDGSIGLVNSQQQQRIKQSEVAPLIPNLPTTLDAGPPPASSSSRNNAPPSSRLNPSTNPTTTTTGRSDETIASKLAMPLSSSRERDIRGAEEHVERKRPREDLNVSRGSSGSATSSSVVTTNLPSLASRTRVSYADVL